MDVPAEPVQEQVPDIPAIAPVNEPLLPEQPKEENDAKASVGASIINMTNNVLGSGLVALAYAVSECSLVPGIVLLTLLAAIACVSQIVITRSCRVTEKYTYKEMGSQIFGKTGGIIISFIMLLYTCGSCISYFVIIGDLFIDVFTFFFPSIPYLHNRAIVVGTICLVCVFPLCMMKTVDSLKYVSLLSIISILVTVGVVFEQFIVNPVVSDTVKIMHFTSRIFAAIPVMCVSFNCHYNVPRYYYELKDRSPGRMWMTSIGATSVILFLYLVVSLSGYLKFGDATEGNILKNFAHDSIAPTIARIGLGLGIVCHFPIAYFAVRTNLHQLFCSAKEFHNVWLRLATAVGVLLSTVTIAILQTKVENVIGLNGSLFGSLIMFAIPGLMYIVAAKDMEGVKRKKAEAWFMVFFGVIMCITGTFFSIKKMMHTQ